MILVAFALLALQGIAEVVRRIGMLRSGDDLSPSPDEAKP